MRNMDSMNKVPRYPLRFELDCGGPSASFKPGAGDGIFLLAGTIHSLDGVVVFEVQENSDVTFRLYDWDHVDAKTGQRRTWQVK